MGRGYNKYSSLEIRLSRESHSIWNNWQGNVGRNCKTWPPYHDKKNKQYIYIVTFYVQRFADHSTGHLFSETDKGADK